MLRDFVFCTLVAGLIFVYMPEKSPVKYKLPGAIMFSLMCLGVLRGLHWWIGP